MNDHAYLYGRLLAALVHIEVVTDAERMYELASRNPQRLIPPLTRATEQGEEVRTMLAPLMTALPAEAWPTTLNVEQQGKFALGYYHQRRELRESGTVSIDGRVLGRPSYPPGLEVRRVSIPLSDIEWEQVQAMDGMERRRLILQK